MGREEGGGFRMGNLWRIHVVYLWRIHVIYLWWIHVDIRQNQYNILKLKNKKKNNQSANVGDIRDVVLIPGSGRSPGEGNGNFSVNAWRIPWTEEPSGLQSIVSQTVGHN